MSVSSPAAGRSGEYNDRNLKRSKARGAALSALAQLYPAEYRRLYKKELERAGLKPAEVPRG